MQWHHRSSKFLVLTEITGVLQLQDRGQEGLWLCCCDLVPCLVRHLVTRPYWAESPHLFGTWKVSKLSGPLQSLHGQWLEIPAAVRCKLRSQGHQLWKCWTTETQGLQAQTPSALWMSTEGFQLFVCLIFQSWYSGTIPTLSLFQSHWMDKGGEPLPLRLLILYFYIQYIVSQWTVTELQIDRS